MSSQLGLAKPFTYPGGKAPLVKKITSFLPKKISTWIEPFAGGLAVTFNLPSKPSRVIVSDTDKQLVDAYKDFSCRKLQACVTRNKPTFENAKKFTNRFRKGSSDSCDYFMARRLSFGAKGREPNSPRVHKEKFSGKKFASRILKDCPEIESTLNNAKILNTDFKSVMRKYDSKSSVAYFDPPYPNKTYRFYREETVTPEEVCAVAKKAKGKVLISYPDTPRVRRACKGLSVKRISVDYASRSMNFGEHQKDHELLLANYPLK